MHIYEYAYMMSMTFYFLSILTYIFVIIIENITGKHIPSKLSQQEKDISCSHCRSGYKRALGSKQPQRTDVARSEVQSLEGGIALCLQTAPTCLSLSPAWRFSLFIVFHCEKCRAFLGLVIIPVVVQLLSLALQAPLSMGFPRQGYWSGLPFPSPGNLPDPGIKPESPPLQADSLWLSHQGSP